MTAFQWITIPLLLAVVVMTGIAITRARLTRRVGLAWLALWFAALIAIAFPTLAIRAARLLGIGRGADLVLYVSILFTFIGFFLLYLRYRRVTEQLTSIVRHIAISDALAAPREPIIQPSRTKKEAMKPGRIHLYSDGADVRDMVSARDARHRQRLHHQPHAHAQIGRLRLRVVRAGGAGLDRRHADLVRGLRRRVRRDGAPGQADLDLGRRRVREDPDHEHERRVVDPSDPPPVRRRE